MRSGRQQQRFTSHSSRVFGVDGRHFTGPDEGAGYIEQASEFGVSSREMKAIKKRMERG
ncbi:hypothetical protein MM300_15380 [Evansella sp. LMS18]|uniref:hypothetical protein n=1 Tax=Evansella sp. LMS18 TaxID=2924033 RepID=UPI0020D10255|nr:hypothetical protein [Evansella sp. LMS18]UTR09275.1 hypothetical protein MM300_15380 [Evansella sp. LMS18]